jgi:glutamine cyclotransferase
MQLSSDVKDRFSRWLRLALLGALFVSGGGLLLPARTAQAQGQGARFEFLVPRVIREIPHDAGAWMQGLLWHDGALYVSTGLYGRTSLRRLNPATGEIAQQRDVHRAYFGEGLALVGERLIQLTWQEKTAFVYDRATFELREVYSYFTQGWGLCFDGRELFMSDGSSTLFVRDPATFEVSREISVQVTGQPLRNLNELECVDDVIYANLWTTDIIARIDKASGEVTAYIDAAALRARALEVFSGTNVTNGIAYNPQSKTFYVTGKLWPLIFEVEFVAGP